MSQSQQTNTSNPQYDLVSILYHSLEGGQTCSSYVRDAEQEGDQELAQFFRQVQQEENNRAEKAKQLLGNRIAQKQQRMQ